MTPCWMISLVTPGSIALLEKQPLPRRPWECLLLIPQPGQLQASGANRPRLHFPPTAIISLCPLVDSCSLSLQRNTDYLSLRPPEPLSHQLHLFLPQCGCCLLPQDAVPQICRRHNDLSFSVACASSFPATCAPSPGSKAATRSPISPP